MIDRLSFVAHVMDLFLLGNGIIADVNYCLEVPFSEIHVPTHKIPRPKKMGQRTRKWDPRDRRSDCPAPRSDHHARGVARGAATNNPWFATPTEMEPALVR